MLTEKDFKEYDVFVKPSKLIAIILTIISFGIAIGHFFFGSLMQAIAFALVGTSGLATYFCLWYGKWFYINEAKKQEKK